MMKMDGRDRAECQNWEKRDINVIFRKVFKSLDDKIVNSSLPQMLKERKNVKWRIWNPVAIFLTDFL